MKLIALQSTPTQPKSISCIDKKEDEICRVWADGAISVNSADIFPKELDQLMVISKNFFLFFDNLYPLTEKDDQIKDLEGVIKQLESENAYLINPVNQRQ